MPLSSVAYWPAIIAVHYLSHITGHGLLKLMRPRRELTYRISKLPQVPEVLTFMAEQAGMAPDAAYSTFNMGIAFAVYCGAGQGEDVVRLAGEHGCRRTWPGRPRKDLAASSWRRSASPSRAATWISPRRASRAWGGSCRARWGEISP